MIAVRKSSNNQWYFNVLASNKRILCTSETYTRRHGAVKGAKALRKLMKKLATEPVFIFVDDEDAVEA